MATSGKKTNAEHLEAFGARKLQDFRSAGNRGEIAFFYHPAGLLFQNETCAGEELGGYLYAQFYPDEASIPKVRSLMSIGGGSANTNGDNLWQVEVAYNNAPVLLHALQPLMKFADKRILPCSFSGLGCGSMDWSHGDGFGRRMEYAESAREVWLVGAERLWILREKEPDIDLFIAGMHPAARVLFQEGQKLVFPEELPGSATDCLKKVGDSGK